MHSSERILSGLLLLVLGFLVPGLNGLTGSDVDLIFPEVVKQGDNLSMHCKFNDKKFTNVYSVIWYKGSREIFRVTPKENPPKREAQFPGIIINKDQSTLQKIQLRNVPLHLTGSISCEVTLENTFKTVTKEGYLTVVVPAEKAPRLEVYPGHTKYHTVPQSLKLVCFAGESVPGANISFCINDDPCINASSHQITPVKNHNESDGKSYVKESRTAEMRLQLSEQKFIYNTLRIHCVSSIYNITSKSDEFRAEIQITPRPVTASGLGNRNNAGWTHGGILRWLLNQGCMGFLALIYCL